MKNIPSLSIISRNMHEKQKKTLQNLMILVTLKTFRSLQLRIVVRQSGKRVGPKKQAQLMRISGILRISQTVTLLNTH